MTTPVATTPTVTVAAASCFVCGSARRIETHHVAPGWPLTVPLCHECHRWQTQLGWATGVLGAGVAGKAAVEQRMWSIVHGLIALTVARAHAAGDNTAHLRRTHRAVLRLLTEITNVPLGPDPTRNTYREP